MSDTGRLDGRHILIVDDDPDIRETVNAVMQSEGAATTTVADGNAAVKVCADDPPDLVVLDMMLPQRSGFLVLEKIKGYEDSPLVIMITANEGRRHRNYATELGADAYLQKPVPMELLVGTAARLIGQRDAEEADLYEDDDDDSEE